MNAINKVSGTNISIYHTFHDEVDEQRKHIWKCNGKCVHKAPYFGIVKRAMNRAPGPKDSWYARHARECGGQWTKIGEPIKIKKIKQPSKKKRKIAVSNNKNIIPNQKSVKDYFETDNGPPKKKRKINNNNDNNNDINDDINDETVRCPVCSKDIIKSNINIHLDSCLS